MSEVELRSFDGADASDLRLFADAEAAANAGDPVWAALPGRQDPAAVVAPSAPFRQRGGEARLFVALRGGAPVGRVAALRGPRLLDPDAPDRPLGLFAYYECADDPAAAAALLDAARGWLREAGVPRLLGPMNGSTWQRYRFVTGGHERGPFLLEPYNPPRYAAQVEAAGFRPWRTYSTLRMPLTPVPALELAWRRCARQGVAFEPLDLTQAEAALPVLYDLSCRIFAGKTAYSEIGRDEFQRLYAGASAILEPGLSWLARDPQGAPCGFVFAYPDLLEPMRTRQPRPRATVLKTIGALPGGPKGVGWALCHLHVQAAIERGYTHTYFALMEKYEELLRYTGDAERMKGGETGQVWKEYALFAREA